MMLHGKAICFFILLLLTASCGTLPPAIFLDASSDARVWKTEPIIRISPPLPFQDLPLDPAATARLNARNGEKSRVIESLEGVNDQPEIEDIQKDAQSELPVVDITLRSEKSGFAPLAAGDIDKAVLTASHLEQATGNLKSEMIYSRKLSYGDVIYLTLGQHHLLEGSLFLPLQNSQRIPLRFITEGLSDIKDYERVFLNFFITTHLKHLNDTADPAEVLGIQRAYAENRISLWNSLMENIYFQYSTRTGNALVVDMQKVLADVPVDFISNTSPSEVITRPLKKFDESGTYLVKINMADEINSDREIQYYLPETPFGFSLSAVELNGARLIGSSIENQTWSVLDWKESKIGYVLKYDKGKNGEAINIPLDDLSTRRHVINEKKSYVLDISTAPVVRRLWVPKHEIGMAGANSGSILRADPKNDVIKIGPRELRLIKPEMLKRSTLKKYFNLK